MKIYPYYTKFAIFWLPHLKQDPKKLSKSREIHLLTEIFSLSLLIASYDSVHVQYFHCINECIISYNLGFFLNMYTLYAPCGPKICIINYYYYYYYYIIGVIIHFS